MFEAFNDIASRHGFPADFPTPDAATDLARILIADPAVYSLVAEVDGKVSASNFLSEADAIKAVGPITVDPAMQGRGIGRKLMQTVCDKADGSAGIRLLQDGFNMGSLALYASLGFEVREPVVVMTGMPFGTTSKVLTVRPMVDGDVEACDELCKRILGVSRRREIENAVRSLSPLVAERSSKIVGYMTAPSLWLANHGVAHSASDMHAMILGAAAVNPSVSFLLPTRQTASFRWCLDQGMQVAKPMTIMAKGHYRLPTRPYMPSVFY
ncbi:GNAT family N-acetyltransferase [Mesorhizobium sp. 10J20-29]